MLSKLLFMQTTAAPAPAAAAPAAGAAGAGGGLDILNVVILPVGMIAIFYFLMFRPQSQREKKRKEQLAQLKRGDMILTQSGIIGKITKLGEGSDEVIIETGEGTKLTVLKSTIHGPYAKPAPQAANDQG